MSEAKSGTAFPAHYVSLRSIGPRMIQSSNCQGAGFGGGEAFAHLRPVHRVPPRLEIIGAAVLIIEIIGVLPNVVSKQGPSAVHKRSILIRPRLDGEFSVAQDGDKYPARAEQLGAGVIEGGLQLIEAAEILGDLRRQVTARLAAAARTHDLPEHTVVGVATHVVAHSGA